MTSPTPSTPAAVMDHEHGIQTGLVDALCAALDAGAGPAPVEEILDRLVAYSSAHFMSEELLMRLASYDDYDDHVGDHIRMMDELNGILALHKERLTLLALDKARAVQGFLVNHIQSRDSRFAAWRDSAQTAARA